MKPEAFAPLSAEDAAYILSEVEAFEPHYTLVLPYVPANARGGWLAVLGFAAEVVSTPGRVSNPMLGAIRLEWWREALGEIFSDQEARRHPVVTALQRTVRGRPSSQVSFERLVDGVQLLLSPDTFETFDGAATIAHEIYTTLETLLAELLDEPGFVSGLELHAMARVRPNSELQLPDEGHETFARRWSRSMAQNPELEAGLIERIDRLRANQKGESGSPLPALPLRLVNTSRGQVRIVKNPLAQRIALFRGVLSGRV